ncbi:MAG: hypothetical protein HYS07_04755 [Chlamydiae bacterium]|nr:hypothetical protein [Chlamydiota bacterium]MBI3276200.1 hypothetical protein [Chlamydiota bacterium]
MPQVIEKFKKVWEVFQETRQISRVLHNESIFKFLQQFSDHCMKEKNRGGFDQYLKDYRAIGKIKIEKDWHQDSSSGEGRLLYSNSLFSKGCLRVKLDSRDRALIVFLPGYRMDAADVLEREDHFQNISGIAQSLQMGLACWDWPLQGPRLEKGLYLKLKSVYSAEREYSRILPNLGTSLWREFVAELQFALSHLRRYVGLLDVHVIGWSMGGCFSYLAPLLEPSITKVVSAGSCAAIKDLLEEGKTRLHGYFFYPLNSLHYFDLENIVEKVILQKHPLLIIHGDRDAGCLDRTRRLVLEKVNRKGLHLEVLKNHGHVFSASMKSRIKCFLENPVEVGQRLENKHEKVEVGFLKG